MKIHPLLVSLAGGAIVVSSLFSYQLMISGLSVSAANIGMLESSAYLTLGGLFTGLVLAFLGLTRAIQQFAPWRDSHNGFSTTTTLSLAIRHQGFWKLFIVTALSYGLLFGVISGSLVLNSAGGISMPYGVQVPSLVPVVCCGAMGQMPQLVVYLTDHFALLVIPVNLAILFTISWLVGLNASMATFSYKSRPKGAGLRWISSLGAVVGLFTVCPSCAGFFFLSMLSITGAAALSLTVSSLQTVFLALGIPFLLVSPMLALRRTTSNEICAVSRNSQPAS